MIIFAPVIINNLKTLKKVLLMLVLLTSMMGWAQDRGVFTTSKSKLMDADGEVFMIRGMNNPHAWFGEKAYQALDEIQRVGCNTVRIVWNTKGKDADLERIIRRCIELQMIPMVELHDVTGNTSGERLADMARWYAEPERVKMLLKYERYLLLNIANEWGDNKTKGKAWNEAYAACIDIMREAGYRMTLVIDGPGWGQHIDPIVEYGQALIEHDPLHNILFSIHMYGSWNKSGKVREKLTLCHQLDLPLIVGEFGYNYRKGVNNLGCKVNHEEILTTCNELEYGYMPWSWTGNNKQNQWLDLVEPSDWKTFTWWGQQVIAGPGGITQTAQKAGVFAPSLKGKTILFVYGGWNGHDPKPCHDLLEPWMKSEGAKVISSESLDVYTNDSLMAAVDLIVQCWTMGSIKPEQERGLLKAVREGKAIAGWHGGTGDSFRNNTEYQFMIGGQWVAHPGNVIDYDVQITNHDDEITRGLSDFHMHSEQYYMHVDPNVEVLVKTTFVDNEVAPWINGRSMPVVWKTRYGKGKVFYSSLGHVVQDFDVPEVLEIMKRGIRWAAN